MTTWTSGELDRIGGCVDDAGERNVARRVAVDAPGQAIGFQALEDCLGGVVNREGISGGHVYDVAG
jgi:hypothetical protein